jgi:hypothetical protein
MGHLDIKMTEQSVRHLMMAYANAGDLNGVTSVSKRYESSGYNLSNATLNSSLTAILYGRELRHKDVLHSLVAEIIRGSPIADRASYSQAISACEKYGLLEEVMKLQGGLLSSGIKIDTATLDSTQRVNISGQETTEQIIINPTGTVDSSTDAVSIKQENSLKSMNENASADESTSALATVHEVLVPFSPRQSCEVPVELLRKKSNKDYLLLLRKYSQLGDIASVREILRDHGVPLTTSLTNYIIRAYAENRDPITAQGVADEWKAAGNHVNHETMRILCDAYARGSDPAGAERVALEAHKAEFKTGCYFLFFSCTS